MAQAAVRWWKGRAMERGGRGERETVVGGGMAWYDGCGAAAQVAAALRERQQAQQEVRRVGDARLAVLAIIVPGCFDTLSLLRRRAGIAPATDSDLDCHAASI
jgi:hypothetical protein